ncbi:hypothetical protein [Novosphingobium sp.]|uniref:hypothetical protein n=1 Tax=Novosphingobium sp. TaxID=1874826 RepID=UPI003341B0B5
MASTSALLPLFALALLSAPPALADAAATTPAPATAAKFTLDTPIEALVADSRSRAVIEADLPELISHPQFDMFKSMSLTALTAFAPDKLTPERLDKVKADLAKLN